MICISCLWKSESSTRSESWHFVVWEVLGRTTSRRCSLACPTLWAVLAFDRLFVVTLSYPGQTLQPLVHGVLVSSAQLFGTNYPLIRGTRTSHINNLRANWRLFCSSKPTGRFCNSVNGRLIQVTTHYYYYIIIIIYLTLPGIELATCTVSSTRRFHQAHCVIRDCTSASIWRILFPIKAILTIIIINSRQYNTKYNTFVHELNFAIARQFISPEKSCEVKHMPDWTIVFSTVCQILKLYLNFQYNQLICSKSVELQQRMLLKRNQFWQREFQVCFELKNGATVQVDMDRKYKKVAQSTIALDEQFCSRFFPSQLAAVFEELEKCDWTSVYQIPPWPGHSGLVGVWRCFYPLHHKTKSYSLPVARRLLHKQSCWHPPCSMLVESGIMLPCLQMKLYNNVTDMLIEIYLDIYSYPEAFDVISLIYWCTSQIY